MDRVQIDRFRTFTARSLCVYLTAVVTVILAACSFNVPDTGGSTNDSGEGDLATVTRVVDGDTIEVRIGDVGYRVRYVGVNTPESDEVCFGDATAANARLVENQTVRLVKDTSNTDRFGRLLRYVYAGNTFVNAKLVEDGYAEVVSYPPDTAQFEHFKDLEIAAADAGRGCHPTGIFDDGSYER